MTDNLSDALEIILESEDAAEQIDEQIGELEAKVARLKQLRKLLVGPKQSGAAKSWNVDLGF